MDEINTPDYAAIQDESLKIKQRAHRLSMRAFDMAAGNREVFETLIQEPFRDNMVRTNIATMRNMTADLEDGVTNGSIKTIEDLKENLKIMGKFIEKFDKANPLS